MEPLSPVNHVFVDNESVAQIDPAIIGYKTVMFTLLMGPQKKSLDVELVQQLVAHAASVELVRLTSQGRNALDFTLAYYVGRAVAADPTGYFHIIAKDKGYDPLIEHLRSRHIRAYRHDDLNALTFSYPPKAKSTVPDELMPLVLEHLRKNENNRPKRQKTLSSNLQSRFGKRWPGVEIEKMIGNMEKAGLLAFNEKGAVTYKL